MHQETTKIKEQASNHSYTKFIKAVKMFNKHPLLYPFLFYFPMKYIVSIYISLHFQTIKCQFMPSRIIFLAMAKFITELHTHKKKNNKRTL